MSRKPHILITRPTLRAKETAQAVELAFPDHFDLTLAPLLEVVEEPADPDLDGVQGVLFTSQNAVEVAARRWELTHLPALCVGNATTQAAQKAGFAAHSAEGDASTLATLAVMSYLPGAGDYLHLRGEHGAGDLAGALAVEGIGLREAIIYDQRPVSLPEDVLDLLAAGEFDAVLLYSQRTAALLLDAIKDVPLPLQTSLIALSHGVAEALPNAISKRLIVAERPDQPAMLAQLSNFAVHNFQ